MKNKRALTLLLAASMVIPQLAVFASAASDFNYIKIEEEVLVKNGTFDEAPVVKQDNARSYHTQTPGTWSYQVNTGKTAKVAYKNEDGNGYLQVTADAVNPSVGYAFGAVEEGEYTLSLEITPDSDSNVTSISVQVFKLDSQFKIQDNSYQLFYDYFALTKGEKNSISIDVDVPEDTKVAFRVWSNDPKSGNGNYRIDNVFLARRADIVIDSAYLNQVNNEDYKSFESEINDLPVDEWVKDSEDLNLTGDDKIVVKGSEASNDTTILYEIPGTYDAGEYRLTFDVISDKADGVCKVGTVNDGEVEDESATITSAKIDDGKCIVEFNLAAEVNNLAFSYQPKEIPESLSISNVQLEKANVVYEMDFDDVSILDFNNDNINKGAWDNKKYAAQFRFSSNSYGNNEITTFAVESETEGSDNQVFHYEAKKGTPVFAVGLGNLLRGSYTVTFDVKHETGDSFDYKLHYYDSNDSDKSVGFYGTFVQDKDPDEDGWNTVTLTFDVKNDNNDPHLFRIWPKTKDSAEFYVDNIKVVATNVKEKVEEFGVIKEDKFSDPAKTDVSKTTIWENVSEGQWASSTRGTSVLTDLKVEEGTLNFSASEETPTLAYGLGQLVKGNYEVSFNTTTTTTNEEVGKDYRLHFHDGSSWVPVLGDAYAYYNYSWTKTTVEKVTTHTIKFTVDNDNNYRHLFRFWGPKAPLSFSLDNFVIKGPVLKETKWLGWMVYDSNTASAPEEEVSYEGVMYRFGDELAKGDYSIETTIKTLATLPGNDEYTLSLKFSNGPEPVEITKQVAAGSDDTIPLTFTLEDTSEVALYIKFTSGASFKIQNVEVKKISNPLVQLRSNADIAKTESGDEVYYMAINAENPIYVNYFADNVFSPGSYELSGEFKTDSAEPVQLSAYFANQDLDVNTINADEDWQTFTYSVTIKRDTELSSSRGIRFEVDSTETLYFKDLKLVFVADLPKTTINPAIVMILLKKMEGTYSDSDSDKGNVSKEPVEYAINGGFDTEVKIDHDQSRAYLKHADGRWTYSKNSGEVKPSIVNDGTNSYAYFEVADANPTVGHRVGTLPAGRYTLSFDIYPEYNIGSIRTRIFKLTDGFAVGNTDYVIADNTSSIKVGENNTIIYNFVLDQETAVAFNFYATKEKPCPEQGNFRLDNVSVLKRP